MKKNTIVWRLLALAIICVTLSSDIQYLTRVKVYATTNNSTLIEESTQAEDEGATLQDDDITVEAVGINVAYRSEEEVRDYLKECGTTIDAPITFKEEPRVKAPYKAGRLSDKTLDSALKMLNQIRYIAGISYDVTIREEFNELAQSASLVNSVNEELTHYPKKPSDMEESLFQLGAKGAGSSNLASGYRDINHSIVYGYMEDGDSSNIGSVGHRRWLLNPNMVEVGFGYSDRYSATYVFGTNSYKEYIAQKEYGVVWPAQTMPTDYFGTYYPWSISMGYSIDDTNVNVTLVRLRDNKTWNFSNSSDDGYFNVNNDGYAQPGCIIFRPDDIEAYLAGDKFQVIITGLETPVSYQVTFFDLIPVESVQIKKGNGKLLKGNSYYLMTDIIPSDASNINIVWQSSDESVATVEYGTVECKNYGTATITALDLGSWISDSYKITVVPDAVYINSLASNKKGQITVSYEKDKTVSGYEVVYSTDSKFKKNKKTKNVKKASTSKVMISGLKAGSTYYVKVRSYVNKNGKKIYGDYGFREYIRVKM